MGAGPASAETSMEARIARLESDVGHIRTDVADIKIDVRSLRDKIDGVEKRLDGKIDRLQHSISDAKVWALGLYITLAAATFATMARGFGWI
jgi:hypothetical protein